MPISNCPPSIALLSAANTASAAEIREIGVGVERLVLAPCCPAVRLSDRFTILNMARVTRGCQR
ncbi:hypothetical protein ARZXY2_4291 [Arthrobacter sp. ZXY-2]|nr:hypothetical protein ARZXY2_4291 [Arthrobacter sp. ZXY-2]